MHQDAASRVRLRTASLIAPAVGHPFEADQFRLVSLIRELRGVLKDEQWAATRLGSVARCLEVPSKNGMLVDIVVGQEPVGSLGISPVLACERDRAPDVAAELMKQAAQFLAQSRVAELAAGDLAGYPRCIVG